MTPAAESSQPQAAPTLPLMHAVFVLAGLGTMLLGPLLPQLSAQWHLTDAQLGLLPLAQFVGATLGGVTVSPRLARDLLVGMAAAGLGFLAFALSPGLILACAGLLIGGFGVGRIIATVNIVAGARYTANRGSALSRLNFTWSFGALLSPVLAAWLYRVSLSQRLTVFASLFVVCGVWLAIELRHVPQTGTAEEASAAGSPLPARLFLYFAGLIFIYGGLETCLSVWLTTYALRYGRTSLVLSEYTMVLLLSGLTAGRAFASWLLLRMSDRTLQRLALGVSAALAAGLAAAHSAGWIAGLAVALGFALAPIFPATFALLMAHRPPARTAGIALAASGLGAAALPSLMGVVSTRTQSLQLALSLPVAAALLMLALSLYSPRQRENPLPDAGGQG